MRATKYKWVLGLMIFAFSLNAQEKVDTIKVDAPAEIPALPGDEVEVIKDFQARLAETQMIRILPELSVNKTSTIPFSYEVNVRGLSLDYLPPVIRPISAPADPLQKAYNGMMQFAYGYPHFSQAKVFVDYQINDKLELGLHYDHIALKHNDRTPSGMYRHQGDLYANYQLNNNIELEADILVDVRQRDLIGRLSEDNKSQQRNLFGGNVSMSSPLTTKRSLFYNLSIGYNNLSLDSSSGNISENQTQLVANVEKRFNNFGVALGLDYSLISLDAEIISGLDLIQGLNSLNISPRLSYNDDFWNLTGGADILAENGVFKYLPQIQLKRMVIGSKLHVGLFVKTHVALNSINHLTIENPYLFLSDSLLNEKTIKYGALIEGSFDRLEYGLEVGYKQSSNLIEYRREFPSDLHRLLQYTGKNVDANSIFAEGNISYAINSNVIIKAYANYQNYKDSLSNDILGLPDLNLGLSTEISLLENKLNIEPNLRFINNIAVVTENEIGRVFDLGLSADYKIHKNVSLYMKSYNLLNRKYERWDWYPNQGVSIAGGLTVRF